MKPYVEKHRAARAWLLEQNPIELLTAQADRAQAARPSPIAAPPSLTVVRPDLEEALAACGPAPSEAASMGLRTGTDNADVTDFLGDDDDAPCGVGSVSAAPTQSDFDPWSLVDSED